MPSGSLPWRLDICEFSNRMLVMLTPVNIITTFLTKCIVDIRVSVFCTIYAIIVSTSLADFGHNIQYERNVDPSPSDQLLFNLSVDSSHVWRDFPAISSAVDLVDTESGDQIYSSSVQQRLSISRNQNQRYHRAARYDGVHISGDGFKSTTQDNNMFSNEKSYETPFLSSESWDSRDLQSNDQEMTDDTFEDIVSPQPQKIMNPVLIATYRATSPCLHYNTHWVRSKDNCSVFFVCARHRVAAVLSCPATYLWSNRVTNCVPRNSRWDDCGTETHVTRKRKRRKKIPLQNTKRPEENDRESERITQRTPATSTTEPKPKFERGRRIYRHRKNMRGRARLGNKLRKTESSITDSPIDETTKWVQFDWQAKAAPETTTPPPQTVKVTEKTVESRYGFGSRKRGLLKRKWLRKPSRRIRFPRKDKSRKKWFITSTERTDNTISPRVETTSPKTRIMFPKRRRRWKAKRKWSRDKQNNQNKRDLKRHTIPEQSKVRKDFSKPTYPQTHVESVTDSNNLPTRWWKNSLPMDSTTASSTTELPVVDVTQAVTTAMPVKKEHRPPGQNSTDKRFVPECGISSSSLIVGGMPVSHDRWPWVVSLQLSWVSRHVCGATLVHPQWLVTAAHCVAEPDLSRVDEWKVIFGDVDSAVQVDWILKHPDFVNGDNYPNDIALLRLSQPIDVSGYKIRHACLPSNDWSRTDWEKCWIMGWGETKESYKSELKELEVNIWKTTECSARWGWKRILNSHICVGNGDSGACHGDSGGPLICRRDGYHFLTGVTSWGVTGCQTTGYPGVFTKVAYYRKWIHDVIENHSSEI